MNLDEAQKQRVVAWIAEGLKLSDIQKRLAADFGLTCTYMEVRLLVDDLKLTPQDAEPPKSADLTRAAAPPGNPAPPPGPEPARAPGGVAVQVDQVTRPGAVVSGKVTFTDGQSAEWYLDQTGRLGLMPKQQGYRPSQSDVMAFQAELQTELARLGL